MNLQLALDFTNFEEAYEIAYHTAEAVDIVEAGTPLIKAEGVGVLTKLKEHFPDKLISADMKTADLGEIEVEMASRAGADLVHIMGAAPLETIESCINKAWEMGDVKIAVDMMGVLDVKKRIRAVSHLKPDYVIVHTGVDEQRAGKKPMEHLIEISKISDIPLIVAGGIHEEHAEKVAKIEDVDIVIVGSAITKAPDPLVAARKIKDIIKDF
jgi:3-hexulose-6-phosphate synthase